MEGKAPHPWNPPQFAEKHESSPWTIEYHSLEDMTEPESLRDLLQAAKDQKQSLETSVAPDNDASAAVAKLEECQRLISQLSLFSSNEALEDVTTADLQYGSLQCIANLFLLLFLLTSDVPGSSPSTTF